jgi:hypothetical protein
MHAMDCALVETHVVFPFSVGHYLVRRWCACADVVMAIELQISAGVGTSKRLSSCTCVELARWA